MKKLIVMLLIAVVAGSCSDRAKFEELTVERELRLAPDVLEDEDPRGWKELENGLFKATFQVPPTFLRGGSSSETDPFADPVETSSKNQEMTAQEVLEAVGLVFGDGASAAYNPYTSVLTVVQTEEELEIVEIYLTPLVGPLTGQIVLRVEIYELPDFTALKVLESAAVHDEHSPEREAVLKAVKNGTAELIASPQIIARSGQRAKIESVVKEYYDLGLHDDSEDKEDKKSKELVDVGTIFEIDPILGADNLTMDLNFALIHDTADPTPATEAGKLPRFHQKSITTQVTILDGDYLLVGNWKPTGEPSHEGKTHLIFITASVQAFGG